MRNKQLRCALYFLTRSMAGRVATFDVRSALHAQAQYKLIRRAA